MAEDKILNVTIVDNGANLLVEYRINNNRDSILFSVTTTMADIKDVIIQKARQLEKAKLLANELRDNPELVVN